jgi:hypothetical protein
MGTHRASRSRPARTLALAFTVSSPRVSGREVSSVATRSATSGSDESCATVRSSSSATSAAVVASSRDATSADSPKRHASASTSSPRAAA